MRTSSLWSHVFARVVPLTALEMAISFSWCGKIRSAPLVCMSKNSPRYFLAIAAHSMCQPGLILPQGDSKPMPAFSSSRVMRFNKVKSNGLSLSYSSRSTVLPTLIFDVSIRDNEP